MTTDTSIKIIIADDHELYRDGLRLTLQTIPDFAIIGEAKNGIDLLQQVKGVPPDIILTDIVMPDMDGIVATQKIHEAYPEIGIIALSMFYEENYIVDMLEAGASGYLIKNADKEEIIDAIRTVHRGRPYYCLQTSLKLKKIISKSRFNPYINKKLPVFSIKEIEIIQLICREKSNKQIAHQLFLSIRTVEGHRLKIQEKMDVSSAVGIVIFAIKTGMYKIETDV